MSYTAAEVKEKVDILDVLTFLGAHIDWGTHGPELPVYCPFCEDKDSHKPAGSVNILKQVYHCWNCGVGGDVISLVRERMGDDIPFDVVLEWMADEFIE